MPANRPAQESYPQGESRAVIGTESQCVCDAYGGCPQGCPQCAVCWGDERERWRGALADALDGLEDMFPYVPEFFREKWDHQGYIDRAKAALRDLTGGSATR